MRNSTEAELAEQWLFGSLLEDLSDSLHPESRCHRMTSLYYWVLSDFFRATVPGMDRLQVFSSKPRALFANLPWLLLVQFYVLGLILGQAVDTMSKRFQGSLPCFLNMLCPGGVFMFFIRCLHRTWWPLFVASAGAANHSQVMQAIKLASLSNFEPGTWQSEAICTQHALTLYDALSKVRLTHHLS